jgi:hypothetical protein
MHKYVNVRLIKRFFTEFESYYLIGVEVKLDFATSS